jgi:hypothetical protein
MTTASRMMRQASRRLSAFNPLTQVTPLHAVWADDPLWTTGKPADGGNVSAMRNSTGGGDPVQGNTTLQPIYRQSDANFGGRGCVEFNKTDNDRLVVDITDIALPFKAVAVYRHTVLENTTNPVGWGASSSGFTMAGANTFAISLGTVVGSSVSRDTVGHVMRGTLRIAGSGGCDMWMDGTQIITGGGAGTNGASWFKLGCSGATATHGRFAACQVHFSALYSNATSDTDLAQLCLDLESYCSL